ncbi:MAG: 5-deoxy-glucuronate isomerase [Moorellaceae bacterium]
MQLYYQSKAYQGIYDVIRAENGELMGFSLVKLARSELVTGETKGYEAVLVILSGQADVKVGDKEFAGLGLRADVFSGRATSVYIPRDSRYEVYALSHNFEAALCQVQAARKYSPFVVTPDEVVVHHRGTHLWQREVHDIIVENGEGRVDRIVVGETYSLPGHWSSFPSHKHDCHRPPKETELMEVYHYRVEPTNLFGVQLWYTEDGKADKALIVRDGDTFKIPYGYHPVVSPPGVRLYYLWFLGGNHGRQLIAYDDPAFDHLKDGKEGSAFLLSGGVS